ncbi:hypothetical protein TRFO_24588 [Tritrichomonas foetus]|uniref:Uncharacterized protein n=1 Tax=Tritrichomonas foetus TaxID=1144522 RepID=A0A1J4KCE4_9EUKA|nr:hypothetical protein TRFO_24588 [Tritrichomonas foetus]|eukprot:OHT07318.1 hypothetical protein TRFO_24588 [Tritrichomonas foetus]
MSDVFFRLFEDSTTGLRARSSLRSSQQKKNDSQQWDLKLAAECRLVDSKPSFKLANHPVQRESLTTLNLNKQSKRKAMTAPITPRLNQSQLRPISVVMSPDGSVERTEWYYITDSVEPPPYIGPKPKKAQLNTPNKGITEPIPETTGVPDDEIIRVKRELRKIHRHKVVWANSSESAIDHKIPQSNKTKKVKKKDKTIDIVDPVKPLNIKKKQSPSKVVSFACRSWEHNGYPNSLSFILEK